MVNSVTPLGINDFKMFVRYKVIVFVLASCVNVFIIIIFPLHELLIDILRGKIFHNPAYRCLCVVML